MGLLQSVRSLSWPPTEVRVDEFVQKLRARLHSRSKKSVPHTTNTRRHHAGALRAQLDQAELDDSTVQGLEDSASLQADAQFVAGYLAGLRAAAGAAPDDVTGEEDDDRASRLRRKRSHDVHPVYLGYSQDAAGAAYDTYASMVEEEARAD